MGMEVDLLKNYPRSTRNTQQRAEQKSDHNREIARKFGKEFFDGDRETGYGGFTYSPRFWQPVIPSLKQHFNLSEKSSLLDVGSAKGFMIHDLAEMIPGITVKGIDISQYAVDNTIESMRPHVQVADAKKLPFSDNSFDVVLSINTVHNLEIDDCALALREIERVSKYGSFVTVDAYRNEEEKFRMLDWNLTAKTIMSTHDWIKFFKQVGYGGDYFWFIP